ncbi:MAG: cyclic nucleotide-binding domain-containing protein [Deltaproteobacteria bacterium]|nr:cyclic nucleotide-binding domain-containing protein [Deltaproteobacteria bacterium]MBW1951759.1 cyclic nucleotide-binding domain-containing protein [Deltaproteobacteria bacterium]MBW1986845.1 cyclic nucleotide-binding domain-containing protein [Deltaproteobacteria bacterium]MBW2134969.1 cyclic nucleotide-binding domain-containing protein [Deltaproteobacteria bacterium]
MESLQSILAEHPFLTGLESKHLRMLAECASLVSFSSGQMIFTEGQAATHFYLIRYGRVAIEIHTARRGSITLATVGEGEFLGWSWIVAPHRWHVDARAIDLTRAIALDFHCVLHHCETDHDLGYEFMKRFALVLAQSLRFLKLQLVDVYGT